MSGKRKDNKGRVLRQGESQRSDGKYEYRYTDLDGIRRSIYSWRLVETDKSPPGKKISPPLRELEKQIQRDIEDGIIPCNAKTTVSDMFEELMEDKVNIKDTTRCNYRTCYDLYIKPYIGSAAISSVKCTHIKRLYGKLTANASLSVGTLGQVDVLLKQIFKRAMTERLIRFNPADGALKEVKRLSSLVQAKKQKALTVKQQESFVRYVAMMPRFKHLSTLITVLLGTGLRIGEAIGLRWCDCDFKRNTISVDHTLVFVKDRESGRFIYQITCPKSASARRTIPMLTDVRRALLEEFDRQKKCGRCTIDVDGYTDFIFTRKDGKLYTAPAVDSALKTVITNHNSDELWISRIEQRDPVLLPQFSAHTLRHTFCTRFCENETNIKVIQDIMGHSDISMTMNIYNEATQDAKESCMKKLDGKMAIA